MKYKDWLDVWLKNYIKPTAKRRTYERYSQVVEQHIIDKLGDEELDDITPLKVQRFVTDLMNSGNLLTGKGLSANSVNGIITVIQSSLKLAYTLGETKGYVADRIKRPKPREKLVTCFSLPEQRKIEQAILTDKRSKMFGVVLCLYTGLRIGELLSLKWSDVDFAKGTFMVTKTCHDGKDENGKLCRIEDTPKTISSRREIPLPKRIIQLLREHKKISDSDYIISSGGKPLYIRSYQRSFDLLLKELNIEHKGFHSLRHTFATRAIECGMDVRTLSEILGHKNPTITLNRYAHSMMDHKKEMMNRLGKML